MCSPTARLVIKSAGGLGFSAGNPIHKKAPLMKKISCDIYEKNNLILLNYIPFRS